MKPIRIPLFVGLALLASVPVGCSKTTVNPEVAAQAAAKQLDGTWVAVSLHERGRKVDDQTTSRVEVTITEGKYHRVDTNPVKFMSHGQCALQVDPTKTPNEIDLVHLDGSSVGKTEFGICALEGDKLKICLADSGGARPTQFVATDRFTLLVLKRK